MGRKLKSSIPFCHVFSILMLLQKRHTFLFDSPKFLYIGSQLVQNATFALLRARMGLKNYFNSIAGSKNTLRPGFLRVRSIIDGNRHTAMRNGIII